MTSPYDDTPSEPVTSLLPAQVPVSDTADAAGVGAAGAPSVGAAALAGDALPAQAGALESVAASSGLAMGAEAATRTPVVDAPGDAVRTEVLCPSCGQPGLVDASRRDAEDFCATCDYPLFWVPSQLVLLAGDGGDGSLRRLPGTVGRAALAAVPCPSCQEPNAPSAVDCIRCGAPLHPVAVVEAPAPEPEPEPVPEPAVVQKRSWWPWVALIAALLAIVVLIVLLQHGNA